MKPAVTPSQDSRRGTSRRFPITDFNYRPGDFTELNTRCAGMPQSFEKMTRNYFNGEARRSFFIEAFVFVLILGATIPAIVDCGRALAVFVRALGGV